MRTDGRDILRLSGNTVSSDSTFTSCVLASARHQFSRVLAPTLDFLLRTEDGLLLAGFSNELPRLPRLRGFSSTGVGAC